MKRNLGFDISRSVSMFYIVGMLHLSGYTGMSIAENRACVSVIWSILGVFTFLSAYLLSSKYDFSSASEIRLFYKKRLLRFYPLFLVSSLVLAAIGFNSWDSTWKGLMGISPFWQPQQQTLWYIATLMFMYLVTPILAVKRLKNEILNAVAILLAAFLVDRFCHSVDPRFYYYFVIYSLGIVLAKHCPVMCMNILSSKWTAMMMIPYVLLQAMILYLNKHILILWGVIFGNINYLKSIIAISHKDKRESDGSPDHIFH